MLVGLSLAALLYGAEVGWARRAWSWPGWADLESAGLGRLGFGMELDGPSPNIPARKHSPAKLEFHFIFHQKTNSYFIS